MGHRSRRESIKGRLDSSAKPRPLAGAWGESGGASMRQVEGRPFPRTTAEGCGKGMNRLAGVAAIMAPLIAFTAPAHASIPPPYAIMVVSSDQEARAMGEALLQYMSAAGAFSRHPLETTPSHFTSCLVEEDFATCARPMTPGRDHWQSPAPIVMRAEAAGPGRLTLTCIGPGTHRPPTGDQQTEVDVRIALFGQGGARDVELRAALSCLQSAARESVAP